MSLAETLRTECVFRASLWKRSKEEWEERLRSLPVLTVPMRWKAEMMYMTALLLPLIWKDCGVEGLHVSRAVHIKDEYMWATNCRTCRIFRRSCYGDQTGSFYSGHYSRTLYRALLCRASLREGRAEPCGIWPSVPGRSSYAGKSNE